MTMMLLVTAALLGIVAAGLWPVLKDVSPNKTPDAERERPSVPPGANSLEGTLVAALLSHEITADQYRRAVCRLAERDDEVHPLSVPPEEGEAGSAGYRAEGC